MCRLHTMPSILDLPPSAHWKELRGLLLALSSCTDLSSPASPADRKFNAIPTRL